MARSLSNCEPDILTNYDKVIEGIVGVNQYYDCTIIVIIFDFMAQNNGSPANRFECKQKIINLLFCPFTA